MNAIKCCKVQPNLNFGNRKQCVTIGHNSGHNLSCPYDTAAFGRCSSAHDGATVSGDSATVILTGNLREGSCHHPKIKTALEQLIRLSAVHQTAGLVRSGFDYPLRFFQPKS